MVSRELRHALRGVESPTAVLDLDAFDANVTALAQRAQGLPIRVASKSLRTPAAIDRALAHPGYSGVFAYSLPEALALHARGVRDILVGYPTVDRGALKLLFAEAGAAANITLMIDCPTHLDIIDSARSDVAAAGGAQAVRLCLDVDASYRLGEGVLGGRVHIGARRSPIRDSASAVDLAAHVIARPETDLVGLMSYEGQIAGTADAGATAKQAVVRAMQKCSIAELRVRRRRVIDAVRELAELEFVNGGGTGSFESSAAEGTLTELAAGSGLFSPGLFDGYTHFQHEPAAYFVTPVVRRPGPGWVTVFKGGFIASGVPGADRVPTIAWPQGLEYAGLEGAGEVQTPLTGPGTEDLRIGDLVWFRHAKAGELAEHFNEFLVISGSQVIDSWATYRGQGWVL
ncbi:MULTISPECIES: amino acid deaminase/aldolase [Brevibacterium]|uniref:D-serine deaminase, pyridoxal phosphate-dependent n=1 Tax=Brevibacterium antiquum CNRZ 918 TaxID=1255637 RepID=A0A2H1KIY8_9MICO|nr:MULTISPECIES: amino acid deaminase/aldolase [Brevibacterium]SMX99733.1 D-serine deaminase, pyridoxal phosphate-dependent [Brevibacterium antiquum CNRZ 918]HCG56004.1 amino acid deaminase/aldolase [Brevibacterium sp.]